MVFSLSNVPSSFTNIDSGCGQRSHHVDDPSRLHNAIAVVVANKHSIAGVCYDGVYNTNVHVCEVLESKVILFSKFISMGI